MFNNSNYEIDSLSESKQADFRKYVLKTFGTMALVCVPIWYFMCSVFDGSH